MGKQINIVVSDEKKAEWEQEAEDSTEYDSLSHLIRLSVAKELVDEDSTSQTQDIDLDITSVEDGQRKLENRLAGVEQKLNELHTLVESDLRGGDDEIVERAYELIPEIDNQTEHHERMDQWHNRTDIDSAEERAKIWGYNIDIYRAIDAPQRDIEYALTTLEQRVDEIQALGGDTELEDVDGERFYYKITGDADE